MKIKDNVVHREIAGEHILIPIGANTANKNGLFIMNELGVFIWDLLTKECSKDEILNAILDEYDVQRQEAEDDLNAFLEELKTFDFVEE